ncbi:hypothetical protein V8G54_006063 [Vigna mungo]|uniref:Ubiquitin-like protease family profile domain-containing protein n=1 Tax=Vigna mungo TaxID=3915 RepID=A0AAQ3P0W1_VIGMU
METSHIVHMNSLLQPRHQMRIRESPFKWFLDIVNPIELNLKLLKQLVRRWVPQHHSFRVRQQLVPFDVVDVVMTLGLGVGGLVVPFDESIVGKLWAYERLGLHYNSSGKVFPRLRRFRSLNYGTEAIDLLFRKGEVRFDWYLRSNDRENPIVRAAFDMDGVGKSEGAPEKGDDTFQCARAARVEKFRINNQKIRSLKDEIVAIRKEVSDRRKRRKVEQCHYVPKAGVVVEGEGNVEAADAAPVEEAAPQGVQEADADAAADQDGAHQAADEVVVDEIGADEAPVEEAPVHETSADEDDAHEAADEAVVDEIGADVAPVEGAPVHETTADEDGAYQAADEAVVDEIGADATPVEGAAVHETTAVADEQPVAEEAVDEEYLGDEVPRQDPPAFVDIGGDDQDDEIIPHVESMAVEPLSTFFGDLRARDYSSLGPREDVDNMVIMFAATMFMYSEKKSTELIKRMIFNSMFATQFIIDNKRRIANRHVWQLVDYRPFFQPDLVRLEDLVTVDWVFIPFVNKDHWWCYALKVCTMQFFVIDSLEKGISGRAGIDRSMAKNIQRFWGLLTNTIEDSKIALNVQQAKIPVQPNTYDCGVIMMKVFEIWDGEDKYDGKSMPDYSNEELAAFRKEYICDWILDDENKRRLGVGYNELVQVLTSGVPVVGNKAMCVELKETCGF